TDVERAGAEVEGIFAATDAGVDAGQVDAGAGLEGGVDGVGKLEELIAELRRPALRDGLVLDRGRWRRRRRGALSALARGGIGGRIGRRLLLRRRRRSRELDHGVERGRAELVEPVRPSLCAGEGEVEIDDLHDRAMVEDPGGSRPETEPLVGAVDTEVLGD